MFGPSGTATVLYCSPQFTAGSQDGGHQTGSSYNSRSTTDRNEFPKPIPMFSGSPVSTESSPMLADNVRHRKYKMPAAKPEVVIITRFIYPIFLQICNRITTSNILHLDVYVYTDIILTAGRGLQSFNEHNSSKAAACSEELTCCNAYQGTVTTDSKNAKQPRIIHIGKFSNF